MYIFISNIIIIVILLKMKHYNRREMRESTATKKINLHSKHIYIYIHIQYSLNEKGAGVKLSSTDPSSVTYVSVCAINNGSSGSTTGGGRFSPTRPSFKYDDMTNDDPPTYTPSASFVLELTIVLEVHTNAKFEFVLLGGSGLHIWRAHFAFREISNSYLCRISC